MKLLKTLGILIIAASVFGAGFLVAWQHKPEIHHSIEVEIVPMTVKQQQQWLKDTGIDRYDPGKIDGVAGTKLCKALNNYSIDQTAARSMRRMAAKISADPERIDD